MSFILNNKLTSALIAIILALSIYIVVDTFKIMSLESTISENQSKIEKQKKTIEDLIVVTNVNKATIKDLDLDVKRYVILLNAATINCNNKISKYKTMLNECQNGFVEMNSTIVTIPDCQIKLIETNSSTIKILNRIGQ